MRLVAFDLETTGLDPQKDQILQIGAVCFDADTGETIGEFETLVKHDRYEGDPYALQMNHALLKRLADGAGMNESRAMAAFDAHLRSWGFYCERGNQATVLGFNVAPFDLAFFNTARKRVHMGEYTYLSHRAIELGTLLMGLGDDNLLPVSSNQAVKMLDPDRKVAHTALQDARDAKDLYIMWRRACGHEIPGKAGR